MVYASLGLNRYSQRFIIDASTISEHPDTSFKTYHDDGVDEFWLVISAAAKQVLGRDLPKSDVERERWRECAEMLTGELKSTAERG